MDFCPSWYLKMLKPCKDFSHIKLLSIDPGLNNTGIAEWHIQIFPEFKIERIEAFTLSIPRLIDDSELDDEDCVERIIKRHCLLKSFYKALENFLPDVTVSESPFFNPKMPNSFATLTEVVAGFFDSVIRYNPRCSFSLLAPKFVKRIFGIAGIKGKGIVKEAVSKEPILMEALVTEFSSLDEHSIDAIAVGYAWLKEKSGLI